MLSPIAFRAVWGACGGLAAGLLLESKAYVREHREHFQADNGIMWTGFGLDILAFFVVVLMLAICNDVYDWNFRKVRAQLRSYVRAAAKASAWYYVIRFLFGIPFFIIILRSFVANDVRPVSEQISSAETYVMLAAMLLPMFPLTICIAIATGTWEKAGRRRFAQLLGALLVPAVTYLLWYGMWEILPDFEIPRFAEFAPGWASIVLLFYIAMELWERFSAMGSLSVCGGPRLGREYILYKDRTILGGAWDSDVYLSGAHEALPAHAEVCYENGQFDIASLDAEHPVEVNGNPVERVRLETGDRVRIGAVDFAFWARRPNVAP